MPKRYFDLGGMDSVTGTDKPVRKTERSHEENQERAYIAASRRADRSIEARVQSARMASEIHKRRTGKAFRITEEIVVKEEMYEEEEDEFPRSYRLLGPHMQTASPEMNSRVETYLTNRVAMSQLLSANETDWNNNAINQAFAKTFPNANRQAQSLSRGWSVPGYPMGPAQQQGSRLQSPTDSSFEPNFQSINYGGHQNERSRSLSSVPPVEQAESHPSPDALTPGSGSHPQTPQSQQTSVFPANNNSLSNMMEFPTSDGPFTSELPAEAKMMIEGVDPFGAAMYGGQDWSPTHPNMYTYPELPKSSKLQDGQADDSAFMNFSTIDWDPSAQPTGEEPSWDTFLNDNAWAHDQQ